MEGQTFCIIIGIIFLLVALLIANALLINLASLPATIGFFDVPPAPCPVIRSHLLTQTRKIQDGLNLVLKSR